MALPDRIAGSTVGVQQGDRPTPDGERDRGGGLRMHAPEGADRLDSRPLAARLDEPLCLQGARQKVITG